MKNGGVTYTPMRKTPNRVSLGPRKLYIMVFAPPPAPPPVHSAVLLPLNIHNSASPRVGVYFSARDLLRLIFSSPRNFMILNLDSGSEEENQLLLRLLSSAPQQTKPSQNLCHTISICLASRMRGYVSYVVGEMNLPLNARLSTKCTTRLFSTPELTKTASLRCMGLTAAGYLHGLNLARMCCG